MNTSKPWFKRMRVTALFIKQSHGTPVTPVEAIVLQQSWGIVGDVSAQVGSPRQVLLAGTASLERFGLRAGDLQENLLLEGEVETFRSGQVLQIGRSAQIRLTFRCEPCASLERLQPGLTRRIRGNRGMLAMVVRSGDVVCGAEVRPLAIEFPAIPEVVRERFAALVARIPPGRVVSTPNLLLALGVTRSYARAIPTWLKQASPALPVHRIVGADGTLLTRHLPDQQRQLQAEGVVIVQAKVAIAHYWPASEFYAEAPRAT